MRPTSKTSYEQNISIYFPANPRYHGLENGFVDQFKEKKFDNLMCMMGDITYIDDFPKFD